MKAKPPGVICGGRERREAAGGDADDGVVVGTSGAGAARDYGAEEVVDCVIDMMAGAGADKA